MRLLTTILAVIGIGILTVGALVVLASVTGPRLASEVAIASVRAPVEVGIDGDDIIHVSASGRTDMFAALGYAHAARHAWAMTLWKTTASARRSVTSRDTVALATDHLVALLGIPADARRSYRALPDSLQALFDAYTDGVNASFARNRLVRSDEFIVLGLEHEDWEPWHPIAIEMLLAYLAGTAGVEATLDPGARPPPEVTEMLSADRLLRSTLGLDGFQHSLAIVTQDTSGSALFHRIVFGRSGIPLIQMASVSAGRGETLVATIPGTLALPGGHAQHRAWAFVPATHARLATATAAAPSARYDRVVRHDGRELLVASRRMRGRLFLGEGQVFAPPPPTDEESPPETPPTGEPSPEDETGDQTPSEPDEQTPRPAPTTGWWTLDWGGIDRGTDIRAWLTLLDGGTPAFETFAGGGVIFGPDVSAHVFGAPAFTAGIPGGVLVGGSPQAALVAERFAVGEAPRIGPDVVGDDTYSAWAARIAPPLIRAIGHPDSVDLRLRDPVAFLQGWDYRYDGNDIAASIFEQWMRVHQRNTGRLPDPDTLDLTPVERTDTLRVPFSEVVAEQVAEARAEGRRPPALVDTLAANPELADSLVVITRSRTEDPRDLQVLKHALGQAIDELRETHGRAGSGWRWYHVQQAHLRFPGRTDPPGAQPRGSRYRDVVMADGGHPTTVRWGPSALFDGADHPASWSAWVSTGDWERVYILSREPFREPLDERYADPPPPTRHRIHLRGATIERPIRLIPAG